MVWWMELGRRAAAVTRCNLVDGDGLARVVEKQGVAEQGKGERGIASGAGG